MRLSQVGNYHGTEHVHESSGVYNIYRNDVYLGEMKLCIVPASEAFNGGKPLRYWEMELDLHKGENSYVYETDQSQSVLLCNTYKRIKELGGL